MAFLLYTKFTVNIFVELVIYIASFIFIWLGSGLIISSMDRFSKRLKLSSFAVSFIVLGLLTSVPELAVGLIAIADKDPEIFVGNLLGGIPVIFLFIIPILAIFGKGINLKHELNERNFILILLLIAIPSFLALDRTISSLEGLFLIALYILVLFFVQRDHGLFDKYNTEILSIKAYSYKDIIKLLFGIGIVFISSNIIVEKTIYFSNILEISPFYISLIFLSFGTNLPELSLAIRAIFSGNKEIAFGDYMGSGAANVLLFGIFTLLNGGETLTVNNFITTFYFTAVGLGFFYIFSRSNRRISVDQGIFLFVLYLFFVLLELLRSNT